MKTNQNKWINPTVKPAYSQEVLLKFEQDNETKIRIGYLNHTDKNGDSYCLVSENRAGMLKEFLNYKVLGWMPLPSINNK